MSPVRLIILLVAAGAAIAAVFLVRSAQAPAPAAAATDVAKPLAEPIKQVLVARHEIEVGKFVTAEDLKWQAWPDNTATGSFFEQKKEPEALEKMVGAVARFSFVEGEPITATKLVQPGDSSFMAAMLSPGMRATSIEISAETAAGGFILPNDRVDVLVVREVDSDRGNGGSAKQVRSDLILANIRVLAIDGIYAPPKAEGENATGQGAVLVGSRATLELSEKDVAVVNAAKKAGELALALRSVADLQAPSGATGYGRVYRDGVSEGSTGVRIYRYGTETVGSASAG
jgi:pilus assembly protein CpaB